MECDFCHEVKDNIEIENGANICHDCMEEIVWIDDQKCGWTYTVWQEGDICSVCGKEIAEDDDDIGNPVLVYDAGNRCLLMCVHHTDIIL